MTPIERARTYIAALAAEDEEHTFAREVLGGQWDHRTDVQRALEVEEARDAVKVADRRESAASKAYDEGRLTQRQMEVVVNATMDAMATLIELEDKYGL
jgi:predicted DNA binding protein